MSPKILASLKPSWPEARITSTPKPVGQNHIGPKWLESHQSLTSITSVPKEGDASPWNHIRAQLVPCGDQSMPAPTLTTPGVPTWSRRLLQISVSLHQSKGPVFGSTASFSHLEGDPGITLGMIPGSRKLCRLQGQRTRTRCPMERGGLISLGPPKCCRKHYRQCVWPARIRFKPRWLEERKIYFTSGPAIWDISKMAQALSSGWLSSEKNRASKQRVQKQTWQLAVHGYNISCQHSCGQRPSSHLQFLKR
jgi:hypothetical protein